VKIRTINITPLRLALKTPYIWSQGTENAFTANLISKEAEDGTIGDGETTTAPDAAAQKIVLEKMARYLLRHSVAERFIASAG